MAQPCRVGVFAALCTSHGTEHSGLLRSWAVVHAASPAVLAYLGSSAPAVHSTGPSLPASVLPPHPRICATFRAERLDGPRVILWLPVLCQAYGALHVCESVWLDATDRGWLVRGCGHLTISLPESAGETCFVRYCSSLRSRPVQVVLVCLFSLLMIPCFLRVLHDYPFSLVSFGYVCVSLKSTIGRLFSSDYSCLPCFLKSKNSQKKCPTGCAFLHDVTLSSLILFFAFAFLFPISIRSVSYETLLSSCRKVTLKRFLALKLWSQMSRQLRLFLSAFSPVLRRCLLQPPSLTCSIFPHFHRIWAFHLATVTHRLCCVP